MHYEDKVRGQLRKGEAMDAFIHTKKSSVQRIETGVTNMVDVTTLQKHANDQTIR